jgi:SSS family solute:Na+ symporter
MAISVKLTNTFPLHVGGHTFPGYSAVYSVILNLVIAIVLTPVFNALAANKTPADQTVAADYQS